MKMDSDLLHSPAVGLAEEEEADMNDWKLPLAFMKKRHLEKIEGSKALAQSWRMKDRVGCLLLSVPRCSEHHKSCFVRYLLKEEKLYYLKLPVSVRLPVIV